MTALADSEMKQPSPDQLVAQTQFQPDQSFDLAQLRLLMKRLRLPAPAGCPWDGKQTAESLKPYLIEETHEVLQALDRGDPAALCEELGDLLLQILFHATLAEEQGTFTLDQVLTTLGQKLVRRHSHVFGSDQADDPEQVNRLWQANKQREKQAAQSDAAREAAVDAATPVLEAMANIPPTLPLLKQAEALTRYAARIGMDWQQVQDIYPKVLEELDEVKTAHTPEHQTEEIGDLLFITTNLARHLKVDPWMALRGANAKFHKRFEMMIEVLREKQQPIDEQADYETAWLIAKARLAAQAEGQATTDEGEQNTRSQPAP